MLLLPDQTYEQYQGQKTLSTSSPLITLKRILTDTTLCPKIPHFVDTNCQRPTTTTTTITTSTTPTTTSTPTTTTTPNGTNGKTKSTNRPSKAAVQPDFDTFFSGIGKKSASSSSSPPKIDRVSTPDSFKQTCDFFNNIPEYHGEPLGPFSIPKAYKMSHTTADLLKECEILLNKYRIRPDFFCRYREAMEWYDFVFVLFVLISQLDFFFFFLVNAANQQNRVQNQHHGLDLVWKVIDRKHHVKNENHKHRHHHHEIIIILVQCDE